jgi:hypothetical protein
VVGRKEPVPRTWLHGSFIAIVHQFRDNLQRIDEGLQFGVPGLEGLPGDEVILPWSEVREILAVVGSDGPAERVLRLQGLCRARHTTF